MKTLKTMFVLVLMAITVNANASINDNIMSILQKYSWYENLKHGQKRSEVNKTDYNTRHDIAQYLESVGLYNAGNTEYCKDVDHHDDYYKKNIHTCYIGTAKQNIQLLNTLKKSKVKKHLDKINAYIIVNGQNNMFLEYYQSLPYDWAQEIVESMISVPK